MKGYGGGFTSVHLILCPLSLSLSLSSLPSFEASPSSSTRNPFPSIVNPLKFEYEKSSKSIKIRKEVIESVKKREEGILPLFSLHPTACSPLFGSKWNSGSYSNINPLKPWANPRWIVSNIFPSIPVCQSHFFAVILTRLQPIFRDGTCFAPFTPSG